MNKFPQLQDILEAVHSCYESKGEKGHIFTLYNNEVGEVLRANGFQTTDGMIWERLSEFNKTIQVVKVDHSGRETVTYWMCQPNLEQLEKDKSKGMPFMFRIGVVINHLAELNRKRQLEEEQLHFWGLYKWGIGLAVVGSVCAIINAVCAILKH
jgi:hypothetical protein